MPYPYEHAARIRDPGDFIQQSFRSKQIGPGIRIIVAKLKGEDTMTTQAYRFSVDHFTSEQAKQWLEDHKIMNFKFEEATNPRPVLKHWGIPNSYLVDQEEQSLEHVGVLGMHWGVRKAVGSFRTGASNLAKARFRTAGNLGKKAFNYQLNYTKNRVNKTVAFGKKAFDYQLNFTKNRVNNTLKTLGKLHASQLKYTKARLASTAKIASAIAKAMGKFHTYQLNYTKGRLTSTGKFAKKAFNYQLNYTKKRLANTPTAKLINKVRS